MNAGFQHEFSFFKYLNAFAKYFKIKYQVTCIIRSSNTKLKSFYCQHLRYSRDLVRMVLAHMTASTDLDAVATRV